MRRTLHWWTLLGLLLCLGACKHPLAILGEGDITEQINGARGCTLEQFQAGDSRCENEVVDSSYEVSYLPVARPGWVFAGWEGDACATSSVAPACDYAINRGLVDLTNREYPGLVTPPLVAVFEREGLQALTPSDISRLQEIAAQYTAGEFTCSTLSELAGSDADSSAALAACLDSVPAFSIVNLPAGKYVIDQQLDINKPVYLRTLGKTIDSMGCSLENNRTCAELVAGKNVKPQARYGFVNVNGANVTLGHIVINGSKILRRNSEVGQICAQVLNDFGFNLTIFNNNFTLYSSVTRDAVCATGLAMNLGNNIFIVNNTAAYNGVHHLPGLWADGITIIYSDSALVARNRLLDNTDVDLIFGGCENCLIEGNVIEHSDNYESSAFAAMMLYAFPGARSGNYNGTTTRDNHISCTNKRCGYGLYIGAESWTPAPVFGGVVRDNTIDNAMLGFHIDKSDPAVKIIDNLVTNSGGSFSTSCGTRQMASYNISPDSVVDRSEDTVPAEAYAQESYLFCIPNWSNTNPSEPAACDPIGQPAPGWGNKDGFCLPSCGGIGGTLALANPCEDGGFTDVGRAYDAPFCCRD